MSRRRVLINLRTSTPLSLEVNDCELEDEDTILKRIECRRLLLNAGADPTINPLDYHSAIVGAVISGTVVNISSPHHILIPLIIL